MAGIEEALVALLRAHEGSKSIIHARSEFELPSHRGLPHELRYTEPLAIRYNGDKLLPDANLPRWNIVNIEKRTDIAQVRRFLQRLNKHYKDIGHDYTVCRERFGTRRATFDIGKSIHGPASLCALSYYAALFETELLSSTITGAELSVSVTDELETALARFEEERNGYHNYFRDTMLETSVNNAASQVRRAKGPVYYTHLRELGKIKHKNNERLARWWANQIAVRCLLPIRGERTNTIRSIREAMGLEDVERKNPLIFDEGITREDDISLCPSMIIAEDGSLHYGDGSGRWSIQPDGRLLDFMYGEYTMRPAEKKYDKNLSSEVKHAISGYPWRTDSLRVDSVQYFGCLYNGTLPSQTAWIEIQGFLASAAGGKMTSFEAARGIYGVLDGEAKDPKMKALLLDALHLSWIKRQVDKGRDVCTLLKLIAARLVNGITTNGLYLTTDNGLPRLCVRSGADRHRRWRSRSLFSTCGNYSLCIETGSDHAPRYTPVLALEPLAQLSKEYGVRWDAFSNGIALITQYFKRRSCRQYSWCLDSCVYRMEPQTKLPDVPTTDVEFDEDRRPDMFEYSHIERDRDPPDRSPFGG